MYYSRKITDGALLTGIYIILLLIFMFVPVISFVALFVLPVPFVIYASKYNWQYSLLMLLASVIVSFLLATAVSLPFTVLAGIGGIMIGMAIYQKSSAYETWARGSFGFIVGLLFIFLFTQLVFDVNWIEEMELAINESMELTGQIMNQFGFQEQSEEQIQAIEVMFKQVTVLLPTIFAILAIFMAFIAQWVSYKLLNRIDQQQLTFPPFRMLQFPVTLVWIYFIAIILGLFAGETDGILYVIVSNVVILTGFLMALQGFSFLFYYVHIKHQSKALPIVSIVLTLLFPFFFLYFIRILGIIDLGFNLRKRLSESNK